MALPRGIEEISDRDGERLFVIDLAFPKYKHRPASFVQRQDSACIALFRSSELWLPIILSRFGLGAVNAADVLVPKAAMDEYDLASRREDKVWPSGKLFAVKPEPVSQPVRYAPN